MGTIKTNGIMFKKKKKQKRANKNLNYEKNYETLKKKYMVLNKYGGKKINY